MDQDDRDFRRLAWAHYIAGGLTVLMAVPSAAAIWQGSDWVQALISQFGLRGLFQDLDLPAELLDQMLVLLFTSITLMVLLHAAILVWVGRCLAQARHYWVVYIFSILDCTYIPLGTVIGIWAVVVLNRASVKARFGLPYRPEMPGASE
jgi:hypothetical protein